MSGRAQLSKRGVWFCLASIAGRGYNLITRGKKIRIRPSEGEGWHSDALGSLRLHFQALPGQNLTRIRFAGSLRAGGGISADDGQTSALPWFLGKVTLFNCNAVQ